MMRLTTLLLLLVVVSSAASAAPTVSLSPASAGITPGTQLNVRVMANVDVGDLSCFAFSVSYNSSIFTLTGVTEGAMFSGAPEPTFFGTDLDGLGQTRVSGCVLGYQTFVNAPGEIAVLHFDVDAQGISTIDLVDGVLRDLDRAEITGVVFEGSAVVVGTTGAATPGMGNGRLVVSPNPSSSVVTLALRGDTTINAFDDLLIYDAAGRLIRRLQWTGELTETQWDGLDQSGLEVSAGLYFAVLRGGTTHSLRTKILRLR